VAGWNKLAVNAALKPGQRVTLMLPKRVSLAASGGAPAKKAVASGTRKVAKSAGQPTKTKAVAKKKTTRSVASSSAKTRVASSAKNDKKQP